jgi:hypothetical protein
MRATLATLNEYDRLTLTRSIVICTREQRIGYARALTILEDDETGAWVIASRWPFRRWVGPTLEPINWRRPIDWRASREPVTTRP